VTAGPDRHLTALEVDSAAISALLPAHADRSVPACPGWSLADLAVHLGGIYGFVARAAQAQGARPAPPAGPPKGAALAAWYEEQRRAVIDALASRPPDAPAWNPTGDPASYHLGWWRRRQALETAVHRHDAEAALGRAVAVDADLAAEGVDEMLSVFWPRVFAGGAGPDLEGSLHLHCSDTEGEWTVELAGGRVEVSRRHTKAGTAVRGPAGPMFLWLWNRAPLAPPLEVFGRREAAEALSGIRL
jgi:uncharacterized protein (TIGR03083 family)